MAASTITRDTWTNDTGTAAAPNADGTVINNNALQNNIYARIDEMFAGAGAYAIFEFGAAVNVTTKLFVNDNANAVMTVGLTINQGAADDNIISLKSSDVAHGVTGINETDTYAALGKNSATEGGLRLDTFSEGTSALVFLSIATTANATRSTAAVAPWYVDSRLKSGTTTATVGANQNIACFADAATVRFILDSDGDSHQDVGTAWTNFDDDDDIKRLDAVAVALAREGDPLRSQFLTHLEESRSVIESMPGKPLVQFNDGPGEDGHAFVNMSRLTMLLTGAVRQLARQQAQLVLQMKALSE